MPEKPLCVDCRWIDEHETCAYPALQRSLVNGRPTLLCEGVRHGGCGPEGGWFEAKEGREPCCTVGYTICEKNGHIPGGPLWTVTWLPKGYGPSLEDRLICAFPDPKNLWSFGQFGPKNPPPLVRAVCRAIENHLRENTE